jgi:putative copper export protein/streptogramin lyase/methionine-rich copper-binding protein CopC
MIELLCGRFAGRSLCDAYFIFLISLIILSPTVVPIVILSSAEAVYGHAFVLDRIPAASESLEEPSDKVEVFLSEPVDERYSEVKVIGPDGNQIDNRDTQYIDGDQSTLGVTLPTEGLEDGVYTVTTQMLSQIDGHVTDDAFVFGIGESATTPGSDQAGQVAEGPSETPWDQLSVPDAIARYPALVGQVVVVGAAFVSYWLWKPFAYVKLFSRSSGKWRKQDYSYKTQTDRTLAQYAHSELGQFKARTDLRLVKMMLIGASLVIIADIGMIYALAYSLGVGMADAMATKFGSIWLLRTGVSLLLLALIVFIYLKVSKRARARPTRKSNLAENTGTNSLVNDGLVLKRESITILVVGIITLLTTSLMGHGAAITTGTEVPITIDFVHNLASSFWIGGVIYLALVVVPKLRQDENMDTRSKSSILSIIIPRFSTIPVVVMGFIVITGPFLLYLLEDDLNMTLASLYGKALLAKLIIAAIMLAIGGYNQKIIHKNALDALVSTSVHVGEQELVVSRSMESKRPYSSTSSDFDSTNSGPVTSQNRLSALLKTVQHKILPSKGDNNNGGQIDVNNGDENNSRPEKHHSKDRSHDNNRYTKSSNIKTSEQNPISGYSKTISRFNKNIKIEAILGILLLGAVAVLTNTGLPASEFQGQSQPGSEGGEQTDIRNVILSTSGASNGIGDQGNVGEGGRYSSTQYLDNATTKIKLGIEPFSVGNNNFEIEFLDLEGTQIDMRSVDIKLTQTQDNIGPIEIQTKKISDGLFTANASFGLAGPWDLLLEGVRNEANTLNLVATFNLFVKPDLDQIEYGVTQIGMPINRSQPLYPVYDPSRNSIWVGDTSLGSGRLFEYDIANSEYREHNVSGANIITTMTLDQVNDKIWFIDPISKALGIYDPVTNSSQLYTFPNDRIVPSSIAVRGGEFPLNRTVNTNANANANTVSVDEVPSQNGTISGSEINSIDTQVSSSDGAPTIWVTSPSTGEVLIFDTQLRNFTNSIPLPTANSSPIGIKVDSSNGQIWIAEGIGKIANIDPSTNFTVYEFSPSYEIGQGSSEGVEGGNDTLISPTDLLIDPDTGNIYISEHDGHVVSVFNPIFKTFSDFPPMAEDALPFGMTLDNYRNLWVAEHVTDRITVIDPSSGKNIEVTIPSPSPFVQYLATDNEGRIWFSAQRGSAIGYITSTVNPLQSTSSSEVLSSSTSSSGQSGSPATISDSLVQTPFTSIFNFGYEYLIGPIIAVGIIASAVFYVNSVISLKKSIRLVIGSEAKQVAEK